MSKEAIIIEGDKTIELKKAISKILYNRKVPQSKISEILNLSQPMVSNYCKSKDKIPTELSEITKKISQKIIKGEPVNFHTCIIFSNEKLNNNFYIAEKNEIITDEITEILDNLKKAFFNLKEKNLNGLIPEVKLNIAMSKENPKNADDVASFLNGLIISDEKITGYNDIRFGKSKHLSSLLIDFSKNLNSKSIMNIAYNKKIEKTNLKIDFLTKSYEVKNSTKNPDILVHKGDFGIEPCAYIIGKDAADVSKKLLKILGELNEK